jgi:hypothetical protein
LIRERKKMTKEERLAKFRNDSVDEVDTTDLESWRLADVSKESESDTDPDVDDMESKFI